VFRNFPLFLTTDRRRRFGGALALLAALSGSIGCARPGVNVEMSRWVGQPYARVLYAFGQPAQEKTLPDGRRLVTYEFPHTATIVNQFTNAADRLGATIQNAVGTVQVPRPAKDRYTNGISKRLFIVSADTVEDCVFIGHDGKASPPGKDFKSARP
jgi:hypothetical protein